MDTAREHALDVAKGTAIIGIVLVHAAALWPGPDEVRFGGTASVALAVLFLVSGHVAGRRLLTPSAGPRDVAVRVVPLLWLYAVWQPVVLVQRIALAVAEERNVSIIGELGRALASPARPNGELWYLWALALHLVVVASTRRAAPALVLIPAGVAFLVCNGAGPELLGDSVWHLLGPGLQGLPQFAFFTLLGARLPTLLPSRRTSRRLWTAGSSALGLLGLEASSVAVRARPVETVLGAVLVLSLAGLVGSLRGAAVLRFIGRRSVAPYLAHMSVLTLVVSVLAHVDSPTLQRLPSVAAIALAVVLGVVLPIGVLEVTRRTPARWLFRAPPSVVDLVVDRIDVAARRSARRRRG